ncbi:MAG: hypothetical protein ONB05_06290, partial [candidate division KSB1 bacterium]|nr:hypothetical protein [candidate division KSB1 bacterium]
MRKMNFNHFKGISILFTGFLLGLFMLYGCATRKPQPRVSVYKFNFEGEDYRIRSIFPGNKQESYNQLIGKNFVAIDLAQDRIIDRITMGTVSWDEVQKIYEYGLEMAAKENKLQERLPAVNRYIQESSDFYYEIRSFQPTNVFPFNEFKIIDKRQTPPQVIILVDQQA